MFFNKGLYNILIIVFHPQSNLPSHHCISSSKTLSRTETGRRVNLGSRRPQKISLLRTSSSSGQSTALACPCRLGTGEPSSVLALPIPSHATSLSVHLDT